MYYCERFNGYHVVFTDLAGIYTSITLPKTYLYNLLSKF